MPSTPTAPVVGSPSSAAATPGRSRLRFPLAGLLVLGAALAALMWSATAQTAITASLDAATHGLAEGLTLTAHPDPYFVYTENGVAVSGITVTAPDGSALPVTLMSESFTYGPHREGRQVGTFEVPVGSGLADYRIVVTTAQGQGGAAIAASTFDAAGFIRMNRWGIGALLSVNLGVAVALLISWPAGVRRGRSDDQVE